MHPSSEAALLQLLRHTLHRLERCWRPAELLTAPAATAVEGQAAGAADVISRHEASPHPRELLAQLPQPQVGGAEVCA